MTEVTLYLKETRVRDQLHVLINICLSLGTWSKVSVLLNFELKGALFRQSLGVCVVLRNSTTTRRMFPEHHDTTYVFYNDSLICHH